MFNLYLQILRIADSAAPERYTYLLFKLQKALMIEYRILAPKSHAKNIVIMKAISSVLKLISPSRTGISAINDTSAQKAEESPIFIAKNFQSLSNRKSRNPRTLKN